MKISTLLMVLLMGQIGWQGSQKLPRPQDVSEAMVDSLTAEYYEAKLACYPALATLKGIPGYDDKLSTYSQRSLFGLLARIRNVGRQLSTLDEDSLSMNKWVDYKTLLADMAAQRLLLEDLELWRRRPTLYVDACVEGITLLYLRQLGQGRPVDLAPRLRTIPTVIKHARKNLTNPTEFHCRVASERLEDLVDMLDSLAGQVSPGESASDLLDETVASLEAFGGFLDSLSLSASTSFTMGYDDFLILSDTRNMISDMPEDTRAYARKVLDRTNEELGGYATDVPSGEPDLAHTVDIEAIEARTTAALDFIETEAVASLPDGNGQESDAVRFLGLPAPVSRLYKEVLYSMPTPEAPETSGVPIYVRAEVAEPGATAGGIVASEVFPGRYLQASYSAYSPSEVRRMHTDIFTANGWALYSQDLMAREGFGGDSAVRDALLRKRFYAAGTIAAVNILLGEFAVEAAADFMVKEAGVSGAYARALAVQYALEPELPISYIIGERQITRIRDEIESIQGEEFDLRVFHNSLLASGRLPLYLVRNNLISGPVGRR